MTRKVEKSLLNFPDMTHRIKVKANIHFTMDTQVQTTWKICVSCFITHDVARNASTTYPMAIKAVGPVICICVSIMNGGFDFR